MHQLWHPCRSPPADQARPVKPSVHHMLVFMLFQNYQHCHCTISWLPGGGVSHAARAQAYHISLQQSKPYLHICGAPIVEAAVQAAHRLVGGELEGHVGHILEQVGQVPSEQATHSCCVCDGPCRMEHIGVHASLQRKVASKSDHAAHHQVSPGWGQLEHVHAVMHGRGSQHVPARSGNEMASAMVHVAGAGGRGQTGPHLDTADAHCQRHLHHTASRRCDAACHKGNPAG